MKKFFMISMLILSMMIFVACGGDKEAAPQDDDTSDSGSEVADNDSGEEADDEADEDKTDSGQTETDNDSGADDTDPDTDTGTETDTDDDAETGTDTDPESDPVCEKIVFKSMDMMSYDEYEMDFWFYDQEEFDDDTIPLFFAEVLFNESLIELGVKTVSFDNLDPNTCDEHPCIFLYGDLDEMWHAEKSYYAKKGSITFDEINEDTAGSKGSSTSILFYEVEVMETEEDYIWVETQNGKCYELQPLTWDTLDGSDQVECEDGADC